jgi:hypothetical protein
VSAREWRAVREGETHAASKTSTNNTPESFIVGIGASGALLASAAIVFVTLVGLVSFNVWPKGSEGSVDRNVELSNATPGNSASASAAPAPVSAASGQAASTSVAAGTTGSGGNAGGNGGQSGGAKGGQPKAGSTIQPTTTIPPSTVGSGDTGGSGGSGSPPGTASKDPVHPVHPAHPETPHQNISDGTSGKDDPNSGDGSGDVLQGKDPFGRPVPPSGSSSSTVSVFSSTRSEVGKGHGSSKFRH